MNIDKYLQKYFEDFDGCHTFEIPTKCGLCGEIIPTSFYSEIGIRSHLLKHLCIKHKQIGYRLENKQFKEAEN